MHDPANRVRCTFVERVGSKPLSSRTSAQREDPGPGRELRASGGPGSALGFAKLVRDDNLLGTLATGGTRSRPSRLALAPPRPYMRYR